MAAKKPPENKSHAVEIPAAVTPRRRVLDPGGPEQKRLDELLVILRDPKRSMDERMQAAVEAMPLHYLKPDPIIVHTGTMRVTDATGRTAATLKVSAKEEGAK